MKNLTLFFLFGILLVSCKNSDSNPLEFSAISDSKINLTNSLQTKKGFSSNETSNNTALKESISRKLLKNGNVVFETADLEKMKLNGEHNDVSILRSKLANELCVQAGIIAPRTSYVKRVH